MPYRTQYKDHLLELPNVPLYGRKQLMNLFRHRPSTHNRLKTRKSGVLDPKYNCVEDMSQKSSDRPLPVSILAVFVLCITSWNGIRVYSALANWQVLRDLTQIRFIF